MQQYKTYPFLLNVGCTTGRCTGDVALKKLGRVMVPDTCFSLSFVGKRNRAVQTTWMFSVRLFVKLDALHHYAVLDIQDILCSYATWVCKNLACQRLGLKQVSSQLLS